MDDIERWLVGRDHLIILQRGALKDEAQEGGAFGLTVLPVELLGVPCDLQQPDPLLDVVFVGLLVVLNAVVDLILFCPPLGDVAAVERLLDLPVQLVQVDLVDPVLKLGVLGVQLLDGAALILRLLLLALPQRLPHPIEESLGELKRSENVLKLPLKLFLPQVLPAAGALVEGAMVVDVAVLLDLRGDGTAAGGAPQKAGVGEAVSRGPCVVPLRGHRLGTIKERLVDERRVLALVAFAVPDEGSRVEGVLQDLGHRTATHAAAFAGGQSLPRGQDLKPANGELARGVLLEHLADDRGALRVDLNGLVGFVVQVAQRRVGGKLSFFRLLLHPLAGLLGEVVNVVLGHQHLDAVDELLVGLGALVQHRAFLDEDQRHVQLVDDHVVLEVTV